MNPNRNAQNPAMELYDLLLQKPSLFGRLVHIASLWNPATKSYERGLPDRFRAAGLDPAIARWHQTFFLEWIALSLDQQHNDVRLYWRSLGCTGEQIKTIREQGEAAIPPLVEWAERQSFLHSLAFIQTLLSHEVKSGTAA